MRKTVIAIALGLTALAAAACGGAGSSPTLGPVESVDVSTAPLDSSSPMVESPSDALPSDSMESPSAS